MTEKEIQERVIVWKNLRLIVKSKQTPKPNDSPNTALLVLVNAGEKQV